jgi:hypothetical protein
MSLEKLFWYTPAILMGSVFLWFGIHILKRQPIIGVFCLGVALDVVLVLTRVL